jgi:DNA-binding NarL/FixJ family response regulator
MIRIVIADDHEIVLRGLRMTIEGEEDMQLAGEARDGLQAIELVKANQPDVVLLDIQMPQMDGIEATRRLRALFPTLPILVLTSFSDDARLYSALRAGASGYLLKDVSGDQLVQAIRGAAAGKPELHPDIARKLMAQMSAPQDPFAELTPRELDVLKLLARGLSNKEIALELYLTEVTVKGYVSTILGKLEVADRTQAALLAARYGLSDS